MMGPKVETYRNPQEPMATEETPEPEVVMLDIIRKLDSLDDDSDVTKIMRALVEYYEIEIRYDNRRSEQDD